MSVSSWWRRCKRRRPGIYLARTDKPHGRGRHNGYVGQSVNLALREDCHYGRCSHKGCESKGWLDLNPRWYRLALPWWLGWSWVLDPLEVLAIRVLLPVYNDSLNRGNPRRIELSTARAQRAARDRAAIHGWNRRDRFTRALRAYVLRPVYVPIVGALCVAVGILGEMVTR